MHVGYLGRTGSIRPDVRVPHDATLGLVKAPGESHSPCSYYKPLRTLPKKKAFLRPGRTVARSVIRHEA